MDSSVVDPTAGGDVPFVAMSMRITSGRFRSSRLVTPPGRLRPTSQKVREAIFSTLGQFVAGARVLDLFAGSGALGLEALSRGAGSATFVERSWVCIEAIRKNVSSLGLEDETRIVRSDASAFVRTCRETFGIAFMDPPYHKHLAMDLAPQVYNLLDAGGILVVEHESTAEIPLAAWKRKQYGDTCVTYIIKE